MEVWYYIVQRCLMPLFSFPNKIQVPATCRVWLLSGLAIIGFDSYGGFSRGKFVELSWDRWQKARGPALAGRRLPNFLPLAARTKGIGCGGASVKGVFM